MAWGLGVGFRINQYKERFILNLMFSAQSHKSHFYCFHYLAAVSGHAEEGINKDGWDQVISVTRKHQDRPLTRLRAEALIQPLPITTPQRIKLPGGVYLMEKAVLIIRAGFGAPTPKYSPTLNDICRPAWGLLMSYLPEFV